MVSIRKLSVGIGVAVATVVIAYVLGVQAGDFMNERHRVELRDKGAKQTRAILDYMQTIEVGNRLPDVTMEDLDGTPHLLSSLVQDRALVSYIMTDCDGCLSELEAIASICRDDADARKFIFISTANPLHMSTLRENFGLASYFLFDHERRFGEGVGISTFPFSMLVNDSLRILEIYGGGVPEETLLELLGTK